MGRQETKTISPINRPCRAFTLIELAFVTAVLVVLLALAVPKFQSTAQRLRFEQSVMHLTQTLRAARERAVAETRMMLWVWDDDTHQSHLATFTNGQRERLEERSNLRASLPATVHVEILREVHQVDCLDCVPFYPDGTSDTTTTLTLKERQQQVYTITIHETTGSACLVAGTAAC